MGSPMKKVTIHTDGGCHGNPGPGGWAATLECGPHRKELSGGAPATTNNRMELQAAYEALHALKERCDVTFYTDSQYVKRGIGEWISGWKKARQKRRPLARPRHRRRQTPNRMALAQRPRRPRRQRALRRTRQPRNRKDQESPHSRATKSLSGRICIQPIRGCGRIALSKPEACHICSRWLRPAAGRHHRL
jgi:ribonuclease HI